jgi:magnesium-transporting ATPase (P-type)
MRFRRIELLFVRCTSILGENNQAKQLNDEDKKRLIEEVIEKMASDGLRTICIAYKDLGTEKQDWDNEEKIINDLVCIAIVGIEDPVRKEVK